MSLKPTVAALGLTLGLGLGLGPAAHADVLVQYDFDTDLNPSTEATGVSAGAVEKSGAYVDGSSGFGLSTVTATNVATGDAPNGTITTGGANDLILQTHGYDSLADNVTGDHYFSFTIDLAPDVVVNLDNLYADLATGGSSGPGRGFGVYYSFDGFATAGTEIGYILKDEDANQFSRVTFDLDNQDELNEVTASSIAFRIYPFSDGLTTTPGNGFNRSVRFDNLTVTGTVIPEPASLALLGLGGLMMLRRQG